MFCKRASKHEPEGTNSDASGWQSVMAGQSDYPIAQIIRGCVQWRVLPFCEGELTESKGSMHF